MTSAEVGGQEHVGITEPAHAGRSRRSTARRQEHRGARPEPRHDRHRRRAAACRVQRRRDLETVVARRDGIASRRPTDAGDRVGAREDAGHARSRRSGTANSLPTSATIRPITVRAPATETCWPTTARSAVSNGSTLPVTRRPGAASTSGAITASAASAASIATGSASRSSSRRTRRTAGARSRQSVRRNSARTAARPPLTTSPRDLDDPVAVRQRQRPSVPRPVECFDAGDGPGPEERQRALEVERQTNRQFARPPAVPRPTVPSRPARPRRARSSDGEVANTSRTVSLNWRTLPNPAANATSVNGSVVVSISTRAVWARWARAMASGPAPSSSVSEPVDVALAVVESSGERRRRLRGRRRRRRSGASPGRRRRRGRPTPANRATRRAGTACTPGSRARGRPRPWRRTRRSPASV